MPPARARTIFGIARWLRCPRLPATGLTAHGGMASLGLLLHAPSDEAAIALVDVGEILPTQGVVVVVVAAAVRVAVRAGGRGAPSLLKPHVGLVPRGAPTAEAAMAAWDEDVRARRLEANHAERRRVLSAAVVARARRRGRRRGGVPRCVGIVA